MDAQRSIYPQRVRKKSVGQFHGGLNRRTNNSKLDLGSIENGCAAFDLPPEGQKKEHWAISRTVNEITRIYAI